MTPVVLVTGGARGIGAAIVDMLAGDGWSVLAPTRDELDLANPSSIQAYVDATSSSISGLVLNAGVNVPATLDSLSGDEWAAIHQVNVTASFQLVRALVPRMATDGFGRLVAVSSAYTSRARSGRAAYTSSKLALEGLVRSVAVEYAAQGVLANSVAPGFVDTDLTRRNNTPEMIERLLKRVPIGRLADPAEVAAAVAFLMSRNNTYITGQTLGVDGGFSCT